MYSLIKNPIKTTRADKAMPVTLPMLKIAKDGRANHRKNIAPIAVITICNRLMIFLRKNRILSQNLLPAVTFCNVAAFFNIIIFPHPDLTLGDKFIRRFRNWFTMQHIRITVNSFQSLPSQAIHNLGTFSLPVPAHIFN